MIPVIVHFLLVVLFFVFVNTLQNKYCQLSCDYVVQEFPHTVCERSEEKCGPGPLCGPDFRKFALTNADRQYILDIHNYLRNKVALGYEKRNQQPSAENMKIMTYNMELEYIAQCWANTCNGHPLNHDICRRTDAFNHVGQNLGFINSSIPDINIVKTLKQLILLWYDEVEIYKNEWINVTENRPEFKVGHYTQMIWADSSEIGCATSYYTTYTSDSKWYHLVLVCNYGPGGNFLGAPVYLIGKPASKCPEGMKADRKFKGLCGKSKTVKVSRKHFEKTENYINLQKLFYE